MPASSSIEWTNATWNPWHGCVKVSEGCRNCYMYRDKARYGQDPRQVVRSRTTFRAPLSWKDNRRVFTCSWSDFFIEQADSWRTEAWAIIAATMNLTYQILTKRPERIAGRLPWTTDPWPHVWLGVSVENRDAKARIEVLKHTPAAVRFLSLEPLLEDLGELELQGIHWAIIGGESGPRSRVCDPDWIRRLITQCAVAGVAVFVKQLGARPLGLKLRDAKGGNWTEWPDDLRVRQYPEAAGCPVTRLPV